MDSGLKRWWILLIQLEWLNYSMGSRNLSFTNRIFGGMPDALLRAARPRPLMIQNNTAETNPRVSTDGIYRVAAVFVGVLVGSGAQVNIQPHVGEPSCAASGGCISSPCSLHGKLHDRQIHHIRSLPHHNCRAARLSFRNGRK